MFGASRILVYPAGGEDSALAAEQQNHNNNDKEETDATAKIEATGENRCE